MEALKEFEDEARDTPINYATAFLAVAMDPGHGVSHYAKVLGSLQPVASRRLLEIGQKTRNNTPGLGLIESVEDPSDLRRKPYYLTSYGHSLVRRLDKALARRRKGEATS
jgi:DNA-binding MarR family transcriptional regulator